MAELNERFAHREPLELLNWAAAEFGDKIALCSAFGPESMVLLHLISKLDRPIGVFTLDTGRLPNETYELIHKCEERYGIRVKPFSPDPVAVREMVQAHGINLFYKSVELRERCCEIRKVKPLIEALRGLSAWVTGLRTSQADTRKSVLRIELDSAHDNILKLNPLAGWSEQAVWDYITEHELPYNGLHDKGYRSIGCAPCTRPTRPGEDIRAGRWWWENDTRKECGIHALVYTANGGSETPRAEGSPK
jgi:phosphoadenosine phosphosulfate reductase